MSGELVEVGLVERDAVLDGVDARSDQRSGVRCGGVDGDSRPGRMDCGDDLFDVREWVGR